MLLLGSLWEYPSTPLSLIYEIMVPYTWTWQLYSSKSVEVSIHIGTYLSGVMRPGSVCFLITNGHVQIAYENLYSSHADDGFRSINLAELSIYQIIFIRWFRPHLRNCYPHSRHLYSLSASYPSGLHINLHLS
jgi:hypothetical protein